MTTTPQTTETNQPKVDQIAVQIAQTVADDLKRMTACKFRVRVWGASDHARVYTGYGSEYLSVYRDGRIVKSRVNMTWGHKIDEALTTEATLAPLAIGG